MSDATVLIAVCVVAFCAFIWWVFSEEKPAEIPVEEESEFARAKRVLAQPRQDAETGEWYAYKLTRIPAEAPRDTAREPTIVEPMQRKARL
jgi:hypothetical protein